MSDNPRASEDSSGDRSAERARRYARRRYALFGADLVVGAVFLAVMIGWETKPLADWAQRMAGQGEFLLWVFFYFIGFSLAFLAVTLPLGFYGEYVLEHQFGLSTQSLGRWAGRRVKRWLISFAVAAPAVVVFYWILRRWPGEWWVPASAAWVLFSYVLAKFAPPVVLPLFYKLVRLEDAALVERLRGLAERAKIRLAAVYRIDLSRETKKANAAVIGLGSTRQVVLGDTLLGSFSVEEIASVFAHELGHIVHRHLAKGFVLAAALAVGSLYVGSLVLGRAADAMGLAPVTAAVEMSRAANPATMPVLVAVLAVIQFLVLPLGRWYSRRCERACDEYALRATGDREAFVSAMRKLGAMNLADVRPNRLAEIFLFSHPPISKRIEFARKLDMSAKREV